MAGWLVLIVLSAFMLLCTLAPQVTRAQTTLTPILITNATTTTINNGVGAHVDPHIGGFDDYVAYTDLASGIHYYKFSTNTDYVVPNSNNSRSSDIFQNTIVFERPDSSSYFPSSSIWEYSIPSSQSFELAPTPTPSPTPMTRSGASIGFNTVAWEEKSYAGSGFQPTSSEIMAYDLSNSSFLNPTPVTSDGLMNQNPAVDPGGGVIVWLKCDHTGFYCDVWQAIPSGFLWTATQLTNSGDISGPLDVSNSGYYMVYRRGGHIYWQQWSSSGYVEHRVPTALGGFESNPRLSGDLIVFRAYNFARSTIEVYDILTNQLYELPHTFGADVDNPDISSVSGRLRVVYQENPSPSSFPPNSNIYAMTFYLKKLYTNLNSFTQDAGQLAAISFDNNPCGGAIDVPPPLAPLIADNVYSSQGLTFFGASIGQNTALAVSQPNVLVSHRGISADPYRLISGSFASAVNAVGLNNVGSTVTLAVYDSSSHVLASAIVQPGAFAGITSLAPIAYFTLEGDPNMSVDDLLFTQIATPDCSPPVIKVPGNILTSATSKLGAVVTYSVTATDNRDSNPAVSCTPPSGSTFPFGTTTVTCTATDASGNSASATFKVTVKK